MLRATLVAALSNYRNVSCVVFGGFITYVWQNLRWSILDGMREFFVVEANMLEVDLEKILLQEDVGPEFVPGIG